MKKLSFIGVLFLCIFVCISTADATPVIYNVSGVIDYALPGYPLSDDLGKSFSVQWQLDSSTPMDYEQISTVREVTRYSPGPFSFFIDGSDHAGTPKSFGLLFKKYPTDQLDMLQFSGHLDDGYAFALQIPFSFCTLGPLGTAISFDQSLNSSDMTTYTDSYGYTLDPRMFVYWDEDDRNSYLEGSISGLSTRAVPEPTTMLLFGAGLVGLAGFGRKKFKK